MVGEDKDSWEPMLKNTQNQILIKRLNMVEQDNDYLFEKTCDGLWSDYF